VAHPLGVCCDLAGWQLLVSVSCTLIGSLLCGLLIRKGGMIHAWCMVWLDLK
jgi:hypothetical protein